MGMLLGSRTATGPSGLARFAIPGPVRPLVGFAGSGSGRGGGLRTGEWTRARKILFLFTVFSDELLLVEVLFFVLIVL